MAGRYVLSAPYTIPGWGTIVTSWDYETHRVHGKTRSVHVVFFDMAGSLVSPLHMPTKIPLSVTIPKGGTRPAPGVTPLSPLLAAFDAVTSTASGETSIQIDDQAAKAYVSTLYPVSV